MVSARLMRAACPHGRQPVGETSTLDCVSPVARLRHKVLTHFADDANSLGDLISELAGEVRQSSVGRSARGAVMIDPAFAAVAAAREAHARFERGLRAENFMVDDSLREAMRELAATIPTTVAGVAAITGFVREKTRELGDSFFQDRDAVAYAESLDTAVRQLTRIEVR